MHPGPQMRMRHSQTIVTLVVVRPQDAPLLAPAVSQPPAASPAPAVSQPPTTVLAGAFSISGHVADLARTRRLQRSLDLILTNLALDARGVIGPHGASSARSMAPQADAAHPCSDRRLRRPVDSRALYGFTLPASSTDEPERAGPSPRLSFPSTSWMLPQLADPTRTAASAQPERWHSPARRRTHPR